MEIDYFFTALINLTDCLLYTSYAVSTKYLSLFKDALYIKFCIVFMFSKDSSSVSSIHPIDTRICMIWVIFDEVTPKK